MRGSWNRKYTQSVYNQNKTRIACGNNVPYAEGKLNNGNKLGATTINSRSILMCEHIWVENLLILTD